MSTWIRRHRTVHRPQTVRATKGGRTSPAEMRLLVATAGDAASRGALRLAAELAERHEAPVLAVGVAASFPHNTAPPFSLQPPVAIDEQSRRNVLERIRRLVTRLPGSERWTTRALVGTSSDVINEIARQWKASMILLGIGRHSRADRWLGSETAIMVMRHARLPVIAVSPRLREAPVNAVAAVDFTPASISAARLALTLLGPNGKLTVAHVCPFRGTTARPGDLVDIYRAGVRAKLDAVVNDLASGTQGAVGGIMLEGEAGRELVRYARRAHCDLIAMGGHELGLVDRILLGSVRTQVIRKATCSVLIAPPDPGL